MEERAFIYYTEGGYFGDGDVLPNLSGHCNFKGRDSNCMGDKETTIFVLGLEEIRRIKRQFEDVFSEMLDLAIVRHKNH